MTAELFHTEPMAADAFDGFFPHKAFRVYHEVDGQIIQPRPGVSDTGVRIDRVMLPTPLAVQSGWKQGAIGVELKADGDKLGKPVCQTLDYCRAAFTIEPSNVRVLLEYVFIMRVACGSVTGDIQSVMSQNRVGQVRCHKDKLCFIVGGTCGITLFGDGERIDAKTLPMGYKKGNRG